MMIIQWRRGRDSNPRGIAPKLISSQPRYDHFDTSPCLIVFGYLFFLKKSFNIMLHSSSKIPFSISQR